MRRTPLRRHAQRDPVTPDVRAEVMVRDGGCVLAGLDLTHQCRDRWGNLHSPLDLSRCSLEHVKDELRLGKRAPSDPAHLVVMCWSANDRVPTKAQRVAIREYLASFTNNDCGHIDPKWPCDICQMIEDIERRVLTAHVPGTDYYDGRDGDLEEEDGGEGRIYEGTVSS